MASPLGAITTLSLLLLTASTCAGREFVVVSGPDGRWTVPGEPLEHFQIKDTLVFRSDKHVDPVLVVNQSHYDACNTTEPSYVLDLDAIGVVLDTSGYNYFISGDANRCQAGERLRVFVNYAVSGNTPSASPPKPASPAPAPSPTQSPLPSPSSAGDASSPSPAPINQGH